MRQATLHPPSSARQRPDAAPGAADPQGIERELRRRVAGEVAFDAGSRALYATDASNYRQVPIGVVTPRTVDDVIAIVDVCRAHGVPVLPRGSGTSLAGQSCNVAVVIDFSRHMNRVLAIDPQRREARVEPGVLLDDLRREAERHRLTFAPDPATHTHNTVGGMIGNNSCGVHSLMGGKTSENILSLDVLTYDGARMTVACVDDRRLDEIIAAGGRRGEIHAALRALRDRSADEIRARYPDIPRRVSGYNLDELLPEKGFNVAASLVGTEGTCVIVLGATVRLVDSPPARVLLVLGYPSVYESGDHVPEVLRHEPVGLEGVDDRLAEDMRRTGLRVEDLHALPQGGGWLLAEFGGDDVEQACARARGCMAALEGPGAPSMKLFVDAGDQHRIWKVRESGLGATAHVPGEPLTWEGWEDAAVPPERVGRYLRDFRGLLDRHGFQGALYGHFGQGCIHTRIDFRLGTRRGVEHYRAFIGEAADLVVSHGGSLSGEHGDGQSRADLLPRMFGDRLVDAFREFKAIWDPSGKMNPGKVVDAFSPVDNLRLGEGFEPARPKTWFAYPEDGGSFGRATMRCVGVGACRRPIEGTMCPSYRATRDEKHSTRGRAHLLFEMLHKDVITGGWQEEAVRESLDLCLACKGCKGDCPVHVDMATYKAEFFAHYYEKRWRPRQAYAFGMIDRWARYASVAPAAVNLLASAPVTSSIGKWLAGIASERSIPRFAPQTFTRWFRSRPKPAGGGEPVLLWPDTFTNNYFPAAARSAVRVLEAGGFRVRLPEADLCCGRPLYDFGMLDEARHRLRSIVEMLSSHIRVGTPMVVLEPACGATFRDELRNLLPDDPRAERLARQTFFFDEFVEKHFERFGLRPLERDAIVHMHCHEKSLLQDRPAERLASRIGLDCRVPEQGCCGMAGAFGFERDKYPVSMKIAEMALLPAVRAADPGTLIVADGYSCREQIAQSAQRPSLHLSQVLEMSLLRRPPSG